MFRHLGGLAAVAVLAFVAAASDARAQATSGQSVSACGSETLTVGQFYPITMDTTGKICTTTIVTGALTLGAGSAIIGKVGIDQTTPGTTNGVQINAALPAGSNNIGAVTAALTGAITNPTSTLTLTSTTTAYSAGQLIANNATAGSITVPSFAIATTAGGAAITRVRLQIADTTSTAWPSVVIGVDLWSAAPTFSNGDRGAYYPATGTASHLGSFSCTMSASYGDGYYAECAPDVGNYALAKLGSGTAVYWTLRAITAGGTTGASKVVTLTAELLN